MPGSIYSKRLTGCLRECGKPEDKKRCPRGRRGHERWGFVVDLGKKQWDEDKGRFVRPQLRNESFTRRTDAEEALEAELPGIRLGTAPSLADRALTTGEWADRWLESRASIRPATREHYRLTLENYVKPAIGTIPLMQLRADHLDQMLTLIRAGKIRPRSAIVTGPGRLAPSAVNQIFAVTVAMLTGAVKRRLIPYSPAAGVELEPADPRKRPALGPDEADALLACLEEHEPWLAKGYRLAIGHRLALRFGLRRGELLALRWTDINLDEGLLHVRQNLTEIRGEQLFGPPKTKTSARSVPLALDAGFPAALREHRKWQLAQRLAAGEDWADHGLVLADPHGEPVRAWRMNEALNAAVAALGLPSEVDVHSLRVTANSLWAEAGIDTRMRQAWMGHSDPKLTDSTYMRIRRPAHDAAAAQAAAWLAGNSAAGGIR